MNKAEKFVTMFVAFVGGLSGVWGAYTAYDASKNKQPLDEHEQIAESFKSQISSADRRNDEKEVRRVSLLYERYEERWRAARHVAKIVEPIENLAAYKLSPEATNDLRVALTTASQGEGEILLPNKTLGAAYFALGDYQQAKNHLNVASVTEKDTATYALQAAVYGRLANGTSDPNTKTAYVEAAIKSLTSAHQMAAGQDEKLYTFVADDPELKTLVSERDHEIFVPPRILKSDDSSGSR